jgi:hypothetical protein
MKTRASICASVDTTGEVEEAESWLEHNKENLSHMSEMNGCGCCIFSWDVEGPAHVIATLPLHLLADSEWVSAISE